MQGSSLQARLRRFDRNFLAIAGLILVVIISISYRQWRDYNRANATAAFTRQVTDSVDTLLSTLLDAETAQRGFLLTGETRFLATYNLAIPAVPNQLAALRNLLLAHPEESADAARLSGLVDQRLSDLRQGIAARPAQGSVPAISVDQGKQVMDQIRAVCVQIQRREGSVRTQASQEGEAAAGTALLATVVAALVLLFLFAVRVDSGHVPGSALTLRPWPARYVVAVLAAAAALLLRMALSPLIGPTELAYSIPLAAVLFVAWFGGLVPGALCILLSGFATAYYLTEPVHSFLVRNQRDQISLLVFIVLGFGIALLADSQRRAVQRAVHAENAERVERERFETTLASIGDAVVATDAQGRVTFANKIARSLLRWPEAELPGKPLADVFRIVNEYTRATVESPVARVLREGAIVGLANHTILLARDGTEVPIDDSAAPIRGVTGAIEGTVLVFRDMSERRRTEASGRLLASIVESSEDAIFSEDLNGIVTSWNQGAERIYGYSAEEMIGRSISTLSTPERLEETRQIVERVQRGEHLRQYQTLRRTRAGKLIHVSLTVSPVLNGGGQIIGVSKTARDITAQVQAQMEVAEHRERLRVTLHSIGDGVITSDAEGRVSYLNPVAEQLTGWTSVAAAGQPLADVFRILHEETRLAADNPVHKVLRERKVVGLANHTVLISRDGREVSIDDSAAPILDAHGQMIGVVLVFRDTTEKRRAEERHAELIAKERELDAERKLRELESELARVVRALSVGELATSIAHEINQPLAGVVTNAEAGIRWLSGESPNIQEAQDSLALIARDGNRASAVIRRIREFLKKDHQQDALLELGEVIHEAVALAGAELRKRRVALRIDLPDRLPRVRGDRILLQQVILNLIMNGADAMQSIDGPKELAVTSTSDHDGFVVVSVRDSGLGINSQDLPRMFDPFFTTKPSGMGMGLSISRSIVESHGGRIWAISNDGPGLTVQFTLPAEASTHFAAGNPS